MAVEGEPKVWRVERRELGAGGIGEPTELKPSAAEPGNSNNEGLGALAAFGQAFQTRDAFLGEAKSNPFTASGCPALALDDGFAAGGVASQGAHVVALEPVLAFETKDRGRQQSRATSPLQPRICQPVQRLGLVRLLAAGKKIPTCGTICP